MAELQPSTTVADADRVVLNDDGTMVQAAVTDISTYMNANAFLVPSAITSTSTLTPSSAKSIYQKVDTSGGNITVTLAIGSLAIGQYIILDKTSSSNTMTVAYPANSQGLSLGFGNYMAGFLCDQLGSAGAFWGGGAFALLALGVGWLLL